MKVKMISNNSLVGFVIEMQKRGLTLADLGGTMHVGPSGEFYAVYESEEDDSLPLDTTSGKIGYSVQVAAALTAAFVLGTARTAVASEAILTGDPVANGGAPNYIIPRSVELNFDGNAPTLIDDGAGNLRDKTNRAQMSFGTIDYVSGEVNWDFGTHKFHATTATIDYEYSEYPQAVAVPNNCKLSRVIVASKDTTGAVDPLSIMVFEESGKNIPVHKVNTSLIASGVNGFDMYEAVLGDVVSIQRDFDSANRNHRWITLGAAVKTDSVVLLYWEKI